MNKTEFIAALEKQLLRLPKTDRDDILSDYEAHFALGLEKGQTEEEVSEQLGDPAKLAETYLENLPANAKGAPYVAPEEPEDTMQNNGTDATTQQTYTAPQQGYAYSAPQQGYTYAAPQQGYAYTAPAANPAPAAKKDNTGEIVAVVILSIFVALPIASSLIGAWFGIVGAAIALISVAVGMVLAGAAAMFGSVIGGIGLIFFGAAFVCLAALTIVGAIAAVKGIVWLIKWYIGICKKIIKGGIQ